MKGKGLKLIVSAGLVLVLVASILLAACAPTQAPAPTQPTQPAYTPGTTPGQTSPATPGQPTQTAAPAPEAETFEWKLQSHVSPGTENDLLKEMAALTETMSDGRLTFTVFAGGQLVPAEDQFSAAKSGMVEMSRAAGSYYKGFVPEGDIEAGIPLMWRNLHDVVTLLWDKGLAEQLREAYWEQDIYLLAVGASAPFCFWTREPIGDVGGLEGLKIRSFGLYMEVLQDLGAAATFIPHAETYAAAQTGVIDAGSTAAYAFQDLKFYEIFKHYYANKWGMPTNDIIVNGDAWNSLTPDLQAILETAGMIDTYNQDRTYRQIVNKMEGRMTKDWGVELHYLSDADMQKITDAALPYLDEYAAKSPRMAEMISIIKDYMREVGYLAE